MSKNVKKNREIKKKRNATLEPAWYLAKCIRIPDDNRIVNATGGQATTVYVPVSVHVTDYVTQITGRPRQILHVGIVPDQIRQALIRFRECSGPPRKPIRNVVRRCKLMRGRMRP
jgi:hypothetical protein